MTICIVEDHQITSQSLKKLLSDAPYHYRVTIFKDAEAFLSEDFTNMQPDVVIMDMNLPGMDGIDAFLSVRDKLTRTKFIMLTLANNVSAIKATLRKGFHGYISKDASVDELVQGIKQVITGSIYINSSLKDKLVEDIFTENSTDVNLSPREATVLQSICDGKTPKEIAHETKLSIYTVQQYIKSLKRKFKINRVTELALYAVQQGLCRPEKKS